MTIIENDELKDLNDSRDVGLLHLSLEMKLQVEEIRSVNNKMFKSCIQCFAIILPAVETRISKCPRCKERLRLQNSQETTQN